VNSGTTSILNDSILSGHRTGKAVTDEETGAKPLSQGKTQTPILHSDPSSTLLLSSYSSTLLLSYSPPTTYAPMGTLGCPPRMTALL
jgi:hypothetical protein